MSPLHIKENHITFDVPDVPRDRFLIGGLAWQWYRSGKADPNLFGVDPGLDIKGADFIGERLVMDLAAPNKREMLLWDAWGIMLADILSDENTALLLSPGSRPCMKTLPNCACLRLSRGLAQGRERQGEAGGVIANMPRTSRTLW